MRFGEAGVRAGEAGLQALEAGLRTALDGGQRGRLARMRAQHGGNVGHGWSGGSGSAILDNSMNCSLVPRPARGARMAKLVTASRFPDPDAAYAALVEAHRGLDSEASVGLNARLVLILANHLGDLDV